MLKRGRPDDAADAGAGGDREKRRLSTDPTLAAAPASGGPSDAAAADFARSRLGDGGGRGPSGESPAPGTGAGGRGTPRTNGTPAAQGTPPVTAAGGPEGTPNGGLRGAYAQREEWLLKQEEEGHLRFECVWNDNVPAHMIALIALKNIFSKQLPNMPKEYIVRLVLDRGHKSMVIEKKGAVVGGITYRPFVRQGFGEIAFCAIQATEQVRGFGTRLMNQAKDYAMKADGLSHFLTYADNNAVGYFSKQGFTKEITLERERWGGFIKDYDGGTLMECVMNPHIKYTQIPRVLRLQRAAVDDKVRQLSNSHVVYPGLAAFKPGAPGPRKALPIGSIPGVAQAGWSAETQPPPPYRLLMHAGESVPTRPSMHHFMGLVLKMVAEHADAWPFRGPVDAAEVPDYYDIVKDPVDLGLIQARVECAEFYVSLEIFAADLRRMFNNCRLYNAPDTIYFKCSQRLEAYFEHTVQSMVTVTDGGGVQPRLRLPR